MEKTNEEMIANLQRRNDNQRDGYYQLEEILGLPKDSSTVEELLRLVKERIK